MDEVDRMKMMGRAEEFVNRQLESVDLRNRENGKVHEYVESLVSTSCILLINVKGQTYVKLESQGKGVV